MCLRRWSRRKRRSTCRPTSQRCARSSPPSHQKRPAPPSQGSPACRLSIPESSTHPPHTHISLPLCFRPHAIRAPTTPTSASASARPSSGPRSSTWTCRESTRRRPSSTPTQLPTCQTSERPRRPSEERSRPGRRRSRAGTCLGETRTSLAAGATRVRRAHCPPHSACFDRLPRAASVLPSGPASHSAAWKRLR